MATTQNDDARRSPRPQGGTGGAGGAGGSGGARKSGGGGNVTANLATAALSAMSPELLLDLVGRLGLTDMIVSQMRSRIEQLDAEEIFDDLVDYLRRNPEVIVVLLGTVTIGAAAVVYFSRVRELDGESRGEGRSGGKKGNRGGEARRGNRD